jgi:hypothetical protein
MAARTPIEKSDELDILSAIWILSCNDENPIITYRGLYDRLQLPQQDYDVKSLVRSRPELFRPGILNSRLKAWKDVMKSGKNRPGWISNIRDSQEQHRAIDAIGPEDVFRNQFRVEGNAPKAGLEIIEWGLRHIERLRKDRAEEREGRFKRIGAAWIPLASLILALLSVTVTGFTQWYSINEQSRLKHFEVGFRPRQEAYTSFMTGFHAATISAASHDPKEMQAGFGKMEAAVHLMSPFLSTVDRVEVAKTMSDFVVLCAATVKNEKLSDEERDSFIRKTTQQRLFFEVSLFGKLFSDVR